MSALTVVVAGFPITDEVGLRHHGSHFDIAYEISNHGRAYSHREGGTWCYYILIDERMLTPELFVEFWLAPDSIVTRSNGWPEPVYAYCNARFSEADWHGGVTFYEKRGGIDGSPRSVKIGCDFAHSWDEGHTYDYAVVERKAKNTIDALRTMYPLMRRCQWNGRWLPEAEMVADERGRLYSPEGKAKRDATGSQS